MSAQTYCPNCDILYPMAHECCPLCMLKQVSGEICHKCGWAMRFSQEPCRCELEAENAKLRKLLRHFFANGGGIPYAQWTSEQHAAYDLLQKDK